MRALLLSVKFRVPGCKSISSATRLSLVRTRGFASPDYSGFARSENDSLIINEIFNTHSNEKQLFLREAEYFHDVPPWKRNLLMLISCLSWKVKSTPVLWVGREPMGTGLFEANYDIRVIQKLLGHASLKTTIINTHCVLVSTVKELRSPLDF